MRAGLTPMVAIQRACPGDLPGVIDLLHGNSLPVAGVDEHLGSMLVARSGEAVVGSAALEQYDDCVLLRSVAVAAAFRQRGVGTQLTDAALDLARRHGVRTVYLLTTTAEDYFARHGFQRITRADVPVTVQQSIEFRSACPASATVMRKEL